MPKISNRSLDEVRLAMEAYEQAVETAKLNGYLTQESAVTYTSHVGQFVRWLDDDFEPGSQNKAKERRRIHRAHHSAS